MDQQPTVTIPLEMYDMLQADSFALKAVLRRASNTDYVSIQELFDISGYPRVRTTED